MRVIIPPAMPNERIQRQVDGLLDQTKEAVARPEWDAFRDLCDTVLRLDHDNDDARIYLEAADHDRGLARPLVAEHREGTR